MRVPVNSGSEADCATTGAEFRAGGGDATWLAADLGDGGVVREFGRRAVEAPGMADAPAWSAYGYP